MLNDFWVVRECAVENSDWKRIRAELGKASARLSAEGQRVSAKNTETEPDSAAVLEHIAKALRSDEEKVP
jgi:hypothetical protein